MADNNKLEDFRLVSYDERSFLLSALSYYESLHPEDFTPAMRALVLRLSHTECQRGGCPYCNADRAREQSEYYDSMED